MRLLAKNPTTTLNLIPKENSIEKQLVGPKPCSPEIGVVDEVDYPSLTDCGDHYTGTLFDLLKICRRNVASNRGLEVAYRRLTGFWKA